MNILILGAGYVGAKIAALCNRQGHHVTVTTTRHSRLESLALVAQKCVIFKGDSLEELESLVLQTDVIIVTVAPSQGRTYEETYLRIAKMISQIAFEKKMPKHLIYTSSTAVYGDHQGQWVDETIALKPASFSTEILVETENAYLSLRNIGWRVCLLRLSEIYGPGRKLFRSISLFDRCALNPIKTYLNVIHLEDVVQALDYALSQKLDGVFNITNDDHPTYEELCQRIDKSFQAPLNIPSVHLRTRGNKRVSNHKIKTEGFQFSHPTLTPKDIQAPTQKSSD